uniref:Uncharacterized protein n=1 Tax=Emiliania huxleyi TaxID=2903 RepID=A0A7S3REN9_EMIHU
MAVRQGRLPPRSTAGSSSAALDVASDPGVASASELVLLRQRIADLSADNAILKSDFILAKARLADVTAVCDGLKAASRKGRATDARLWRSAIAAGCAAEAVLRESLREAEEAWHERQRGTTLARLLESGARQRLGVTLQCWRSVAAKSRAVEASAERASLRSRVCELERQLQEASARAEVERRMAEERGACLEQERGALACRLEQAAREKEALHRALQLGLGRGHAAAGEAQHLRSQLEASERERLRTSLCAREALAAQRSVQRRAPLCAPVLPPAACGAILTAGGAMIPLEGPPASRYQVSFSLEP